MTMEEEKATRKTPSCGWVVGGGESLEDQVAEDLPVGHAVRG